MPPCRPPARRAAGGVVRRDDGRVAPAGRLAGGAFGPPGRAGVDRSLPDRTLRGFGAARLRGRAGRSGRAGAAGPAQAGRAGLPAAAAADEPRAFEAPAWPSCATGAPSICRPWSWRAKAAGAAAAGSSGWNKAFSPRPSDLPAKAKSLAGSGGCARRCRRSSRRRGRIFPCCPARAGSASGRCRHLRRQAARPRQRARRRPDRRPVASSVRDAPAARPKPARRPASRPLRDSRPAASDQGRRAMAAQGKPCSEEPARQAELRRRSEVRQLFRQAKRLGLDAPDKDGDIVRLEQALART